jgi:L-lactate dehydrogenase complex protein LldF
MLVHLRSRVVEEKREHRRLPAPERLVAASAAWAMARPDRWGRALRAARLGRVVAHRRISTLPPPLGRWTATRDLPVPPRETFREWWRRTHDTGNPPGEESAR